MILIGGILIGTGHAAVISMTSIYYPSAVRSTGGGWASFMAKFAAVAAPFLGARWFLGSDAARCSTATCSPACASPAWWSALLVLAHLRPAAAGRAGRSAALAAAPAAAGA